MRPHTPASPRPHPSLHIHVLYMFLIVFPTTNLADVVNPRGNSGAAIKPYLLVCVLGGQWYVHPWRGFVLLWALCERSSSFSLSDCLMFQEYPGSISQILQHYVKLHLNMEKHTNTIRKQYKAAI